MELPKGYLSSSYLIMENNDHSKIKLLNKNIKVTDKDIYEFNAWIKGKKITPSLMKEFDDVTSYEDFMYDYDPTEEFLNPAISLDAAQNYTKGSEGYKYLSNVDQVVYDQIAAELAKHDLKIEYDDQDDIFKVFSTIDNLDLGNSSIDVGEYGKYTDTYKKLSSLDESSYKSLMSYSEGNFNIDYDTPNDKFIVTKVESKIAILDPGSYRRGTKEYKALDKMSEKEWQDYLDEMARYGLSIEYNNVTDSFIVIGSDAYSEGREKVSSEMLERAKTDGVVQKKPNGKWGIISINAGEWWTPDYDTRESAEAALAAYHANKSNHDRTFASKFELEDLDPDTLTGLLALVIYNEPHMLEDFNDYDFDDLVSDLQLAFKSLYPKHPEYLDKAYKIAHNLITIGNR